MFSPGFDGFLSSLMGALDVVLAEFDERGALRVLGESPAWLSRFTTTPEEADLREVFLYLDSFLDEASEFWNAASTGRLRSGIWSEPDLEGEHARFEATAVCALERRVLLIEWVEDKFERRRHLIQTARLGKLDALEKEREAAGLRDLADELEAAVEGRTRELMETNLLLREEISDRETAEARADRLRSQLESASRTGTLGEIANQLAHELNQPLGAIRNYIGAGLRFLDGSDDLEKREARLREALQGGQRQAERAGAIVANLREFIATGHFDRESCSVNELVRDVVQLLDRELIESQVLCELALANVLSSVEVNAVQIQQVLVNLVKNGVEALQDVAPEQRRIRISTEALDGGNAVLVRVEDSGPGLSAEDRERIFEPYFSTKKEGMGLGLAICRSIAEAHGGTLSASSGSEKGLVLEFRIPTTMSQSHE